MVLLHQLSQLWSSREEQHRQEGMADIFSLHRTQVECRDLQIYSSSVLYPSRSSACHRATSAHSASIRLLNLVASY